MGTRRNNDPRTVREVALRYRGRGKRAPDKIRNASQVATFFRRVVIDDAREHFLAPAHGAPEGTCHNVHTRTLSQNPP
jgi:hypothetical protein